MKVEDQENIEKVAKAMAWTEMVYELGNAGIMAMSPERLEATFDSAWNGATDHDERCRDRFRKLACAAWNTLNAAGALKK